MAKICYQFPILDAHGRFEKEGVIFKTLGSTRFTAQYTKSSVPASASMRAARTRFADVAQRVSSYYRDEDMLSTLRLLYRTQNIRPFKKFLWSEAKRDLGY